MAAMPWFILASACAAAALAGCRSARSTAGTQPQPLPIPVISAPAATDIDPRPLLALDDIQPPVSFPKKRPSTASAAPAPLDAIELFARARDAMLGGQRQLAADLLEQAARLDPQSFAVRHALGRARLQGSWDQASIDALHEAERINPNNTALQTDLGRQYLAKGDWDQGVRHLRLALQASDFSEDESAAGVAELFLAEALRKKGYLTAALELYERLDLRLASPSLSVRMNPELFYYIVRSDQLDLQIGQLHEQLGHHEQALACYTPLAAAEPADFQAQARVVRSLASARRFEEAAVNAAEVISRFRASPESLQLLRDVYRTAGREADVADALRKLHAARPDDRAILFALADVLTSDDRPEEALAVLENAARKMPEDVELLGRLIALGQEVSPDGLAAARRLIEWSAEHPEAAFQIGPLWSQILRPSTPAGLRWTALRSIDLSQNIELEPARLYWLSRAAQAARRRAVAHEALQRAVEAEGKAFAPAYRAYMDVIWSSEELSDEQKKVAAEALAARAAEHGDSSLSAELRGLALLSREDFKSAEDEFHQAIELGGDSPELHFVYALTLRRNGNTSRYEQVLWKLIGDWPQFEAAPESLYAFYESGGADAKADKLLVTWLSADPESVGARLRQARDTFSRGRAEAAEALLLETFDEHPADPRVIAVLHAFYAQTDRLHRFDRLLSQSHQEEPGRLGVAATLVEFKLSRRQAENALDAIRATEAAVADDPDALYQVSHLYLMAGEKEASQQALRDALRLEPDHAPAANDLGYALGEQGQDLSEAERLCRLAVEAEPHNAAFLDSLGWVLYKQGRFDEAENFLRQALKLMDTPDPVVTDHLGDTLYHLKRQEEAETLWRQSLQRLGPVNPSGGSADHERLRAQLMQKLRQLDAQQKVDVAPVMRNEKTEPSAVKARR